MLVFVDESGDAGMKLGTGSSGLFVVTAVVFEDHSEADRCDERINEIRAELGFPARYEFHFNQCIKKVREAFIERVAPFDFFYLAVVVEKGRLNIPAKNPASQFKELVIKYAAALVFENAKPYLQDAIVSIDASGSRDFRNQLARFLIMRMRSEGGRRCIKRVKTARSRGNNLIQLADMISGAIWRAFARHDGSYRRLISARELKLEVYPRRA
jgi:hypothetical protein